MQEETGGCIGRPQRKASESRIRASPSQQRLLQTGVHNTTNDLNDLDFNGHTERSHISKSKLLIFFCYFSQKGLDR